MKKLVVLVFSICFCIYSQVQPVIPDFRISGEENIPSLFQKYVPDIIYSDSVRFITCWNDTREGITTVYAREFDNSGNKSGKNFKIPSRVINCNSNNYKLMLEKKYSESVFGTEYMVYADLYNPAGENISRYDFYYNVLPECGTGYINGDIRITSSGEAFYLYCNEGGSDYLAKLTTGGNATLLRSSRYGQVTEIAITATRNSDLLCAWVKGVEDTIAAGLYASFYNSNDSLINPAVKISDLQNIHDGWGYTGNCDVQAVTLNDSTYKIFWLNKGTKTLYSALFNTRGEIVSAADSLPVLMNNEDVKLKVSNINGGYFVIYILPNIYENEINFIKYNLEGERTEGPIALQDLDYNRELYYAGNDKYYFMSADDNNIFLEEYEGGVTGKKIKVNDDECGSNEINYNLIAYGTNEAAAVWSNEAHTFIRLIKPGGTMGSVKIDLEDKNIKFFKNKTGIAGWTKIDEHGLYYSGYSVYDEDFNVVSRNNVVEGSNSLTGYAPQINIISDDEFIFSLDTDAGVELYKISSGGTVIKNAFIEFSSLNKNHDIYPDKNDFWISRGQNFVKVTNDFEKENLSFEVNTMPALYIGNNRFLRLRYDYNPYLGVLTSVTGLITDENSDTIKTIFLTGDASNFRVYSLPGSRFIAIRKIPDGYDAAAFNYNGEESSSTCRISNNQTASINYFSAVMNDDKLYFTWSDYVEEGRGYNIYGSIYNSNVLVSVKQLSPQLPRTYSMLQNYPNPFNPVTNIEFDVAEQGYVTIKIYDILGREALTLVNEEKSPGRYKAELNASSLSSGTYFCRMNVNNYTAVIKMILLK